VELPCNCGGSEKITSKANGTSILVTAIDTAEVDLIIVEAAFRKLNAGRACWIVAQKRRKSQNRSL
jgi:hypothetical protein